MHVIAKKTLEDFWKVHPAAKSPPESWYRVVSRSSFSSFVDVRETFRSADYADACTIFDIGGNSFRIILATRKTMNWLIFSIWSGNWSRITRQNIIPFRRRNHEPFSDSSWSNTDSSRPICPRRSAGNPW